MASRSLPALLLTGLLAGGLSLGASSETTDRTQEGYDRVLRPVLARHGCRPVGYGEVPHPRAALVRTAPGRILLVSAAHGRAVYDGRRPGVLLGVCPHPDRRG